MIIFTWTPPHFWALALYRKDEYSKANIPMLPVTHGEDYTRLHIFLYTILLFAVTIMPYLTAMSGLIYLHGAVADSLAENRGPFGYLATEVMNAIPEKIKKMANSV